MSVDFTKTKYAEDIEPEDQLDFGEDEYGYNDDAIFGYALVERVTEWYSGEDGTPWVTLYTSQGSFEMPASHRVKVRVVE